MRKVMAIIAATGMWLAAGTALAQSRDESGLDLEPAEEKNTPATDETSSSRSSSSSGTDGQTECDYHVDCPSKHVCWRGTCVQSSEAIDVFMQNDQSADAKCGADRRCRINRLKRQNRARRQARKIEEERYVENLVDERQKKQLQAIPRRDNPIGFDLRISRMGAAGLTGGYSLLGRLRPELHFVHWAADVGVDYEDEYFDGRQPTNFLIPGLYYFFTDGPFAPYASAAFVYGWGSFDRYGSTSFDDEGNSTTVAPDSLDTEYHAVEIGAGLDYQVKKLGAHLRLGLAYRPLIYNQARRSPGQYHKRSREALEKWFEQMAQIDVIFLAGWAF